MIILIYRRASSSSSGKALSWADIAASPNQATGKGSERSKSAAIVHSSQHQPPHLRQNQSDGTRAVLTQLPGTRSHVPSSALDQRQNVGLTTATGNRTFADGTGSTPRPVEVPRQLASSVNNDLDAATRVIAEGRGPTSASYSDMSALGSCGREQLVAER